MRAIKLYFVVSFLMMVLCSPSVSYGIIYVYCFQCKQVGTAYLPTCKYCGVSLNYAGSYLLLPGQVDIAQCPTCPVTTNSRLKYAWCNLVSTASNYFIGRCNVCSDYFLLSVPLPYPNPTFYANPNNWPRGDCLECLRYEVISPDLRCGVLAHQPVPDPDPDPEPDPDPSDEYILMNMQVEFDYVGFLSVALAALGGGMVAVLGIQLSVYVVLLMFRKFKSGVR